MYRRAAFSRRQPHSIEQTWSSCAGRLTRGKTVDEPGDRFYFWCRLPHSIESNTPRGLRRRTAIYREGTLIGGSARDERTVVSRLAHGATTARSYTVGVC